MNWRSLSNLSTPGPAAALVAVALALACLAFPGLEAAVPSGPAEAVRSAQIPSQSLPPIVVMGSYKCDRAQTAAIDDYVLSVQKPIMDAMIEEGWLLDWGFLVHHYGDEWNRVIYYVSENLARHVEMSGELTRRLGEAVPGEISPFTAHCFEHKDNIYDRLVP